MDLRGRGAAYLFGWHHLLDMNLLGDLSGACTSAVKVGGWCLDGGYHQG